MLWIITEFYLKSCRVDPHWRSSDPDRRRGMYPATKYHFVKLTPLTLIGTGASRKEPPGVGWLKGGYAFELLIIIIFVVFINAPSSTSLCSIVLDVRKRVRIIFQRPDPLSACSARGAKDHRHAPTGSDVANREQRMHQVQSRSRLRASLSSTTLGPKSKPKRRESRRS
jgi:hypothetical protein